MGWAPYIFRTILSENQYDTKFMTRASTKAITMPLSPPTRPPTAMNRPVRRARNRVVFTMLFIITPRSADMGCPIRSSGVT